ncbi:MAG: CCA tRNA nucleotidyltransferase, partial [Clostridia bacterium]|nr:CCA tRNA nucleotidyltransferase [Clostridia bacterium]
MIKRGVKNYTEIIECLKNIILGTKFENHVFSVGGCERDLILDSPIKDIDIVIDLPNGGIEFANWLKDNGHTVGSVVVYEHFGTAMFRLKDYPDEEIEAVQTRKECYRDMESRNPETAFGSIMDDCQRRDFTINAIYRNISTGDILDLNGKSFDDITDGWIRACGDPNIIFSEDPLRILRAVRFKYRLGDHFLIEKDTYQGIFTHKDRLSIISQERITDEFNKIITGKDADQAFIF